MAAFFPTNGEPPAGPTKVRVQCEAKDCKALLEVNVSSDCPEGTPVIVRCGSCQRLLQVNLSAVSHGYGQQHAPTHHQQYQMAAQSPFLSPRSHYPHHHPSTPGQDPRSLSLTNHLVQPPPLSRYHNYPGQMRTGYLGHMEPLMNPYHPADLQPHSAGSPYSSTHFGGFNEHSPQHFNHGFNESPFGAVRRKKKDKSRTKPRNPSPYNLFMSREVKRIKADQPELDHREAFKQAASNWAKSPNNCSNQRTPVFPSGLKDEAAMGTTGDSGKPPTEGATAGEAGTDTPDPPQDIVRMDSALAPLQNEGGVEGKITVGDSEDDQREESVEGDGEVTRKPEPVVEDMQEHPVVEEVQVELGTKRLSQPGSPSHSVKKIKVESAAVDESPVCS